jgi:hypothetical protein
MNKTLTDAPFFDFDTRIGALRAKRSAPNARIADIHRKFSDWRGEQLAAGAVTTEAPQAVNDALLDEQRKIAEIGRTTYEADRRELANVVARHVARTEAFFAGLIDATETFERFEREHAAYAREAGVSPFPTLTSGLPSAHQFREWKHRVDVMLNPPVQKARPVARALSLD